MCACLLAIAGEAAATPDVWATGTAEISTDPGYEGFWKYCYEVSWCALPHGVSHVDVLLWMVQDCPCLCSQGYFAFADTVGSGPGTPNGEPCIVCYHGMFECNGDPSVGLEMPVIKFEPYEDHCEPDVEGWAHLCFYSVAEPIGIGSGECVGIKFAGEFAVGDLTGVLPGCDTERSSPAPAAWGKIKALYR
jgi:hypothetical protein